MTRPTLSAPGASMSAALRGPTLEQFIAALNAFGWRDTADAQHEGVAELHRHLWPAFHPDSMAGGPSQETLRERANDPDRQVLVAAAAAEWRDRVHRRVFDRQTNDPAADAPVGAAQPAEPAQGAAAPAERGMLRVHQPDGTITYQQKPLGWDTEWSADRALGFEEGKAEGRRLAQWREPTPREAGSVPVDRHAELRRILSEPVGDEDK